MTKSEYVPRIEAHALTVQADPLTSARLATLIGLTPPPSWLWVPASYSSSRLQAQAAEALAFIRLREALVQLDAWVHQAAGGDDRGLYRQALETLAAAAAGETPAVSVASLLASDGRIEGLRGYTPHLTGLVTPESRYARQRAYRNAEVQARVLVEVSRGMGYQPGSPVADQLIFPASLSEDALLDRWDPDAALRAVGFVDRTDTTTSKAGTAGTA